MRQWLLQFSWDDLRRWGNSRLIRTSYIWLIVVPVAAKALYPIAGEHDFWIMGEKLTVNLRLPFNWGFFFAMAIVFAIAQGFYTLACPPLVRKFSSSSEYLATHRGVIMLSNTLRIFGARPDVLDDVTISMLRNILGPGMNPHEHGTINDLVEKGGTRAMYFELAEMLEQHQEDRVVGDVFDAIWASLNVSRFPSRVICSTLFYVGFLLFILVMMQNCRSVYRMTSNQDDAPQAVSMTIQCENCEEPATIQVDHVDRRGTYCAEHGDAARERAGFPDGTDLQPSEPRRGGG